MILMAWELATWPASLARSRAVQSSSVRAGKIDLDRENCPPLKPGIASSSAQIIAKGST